MILPRSPGQFYVTSRVADRGVGAIGVAYSAGPRTREPRDNASRCMNLRVSRIATGSFLVLAAIFAAASLYAICRQAIYIPYQDQWGWIDRYVTGQETRAALLLTPINGHIVAVPGLVYWIDAAFTNASNRVNLAAMIACIAGICLLLRRGFARLADAFRGRTANVYLGVAVVLMLWFHHWENLFWPFQVHEYLSIVLALGCLFLLSATAATERPGAFHTAAALMLGLLAGASFGPGLGVWAPALLVVVLGRGRAVWRWVAAAAMVGIAALFVWYLSFWIAHESHPIGIGASIEFVALYLGSPFFHGHNERVLTTAAARLFVPLAAGYAGLLLAGAVGIRLLRLRARRPLSAAELFFAAVAVFALVVGAMLALVRGGGEAPTPALSSRYGVLALLFWLSAVPLGIAGLGVVRLRIVEAVGPLVLLAFVVRSQVDYLGWWLNWRSMIEGASAALVSGVPDPDYLAYVLNRSDMVERVTGDLLRERLSPLYEEQTRWIGRPLPDAARPLGRCVAELVPAEKVRGGYRIAGTVESTGLPFAERPVFILRDDGKIFGLGNVDRGWYGRWRDFGAPRMRAWRAFAPVDESALASLRVLVSTGDGLCEVTRLPGR